MRSMANTLASATPRMRITSDIGRRSAHVTRPITSPHFQHLLSALLLFALVGAALSIRLAAEDSVKIVEDRRAARDPIVVVVRLGADAMNESLDAAGFLASELLVLEIDVVDDLRDGLQRLILEPGTREQDLEAAAVALMRELRIEHVEAQLVRLG